MQTQPLCRALSPEKAAPNRCQGNSMEGCAGVFSVLMHLQQLLLGMAQASPAMLAATTLSSEPLSTNASANSAGTCIGHNRIIAQL